MGAGPSAKWSSSRSSFGSADPNYAGKKSSDGSSKCMYLYAEGETMASSRSAFSLVALALCLSCGNADAQTAGIPSTSVERQVLSLNLTNNGQHLEATVGQQIEISLAAMAACDPRVSSAAIRLESVALPWPVNPGLATHIYIFDAAAEGEAEVKVPITDCPNPDLPDGLTFAVTIRVGRTNGGRSTPYATRTSDQANTAPWKDGWTNLEGNFLRQTFTPSLPRLTAVEVELVVGNHGPDSAEITMNLENAEGKLLALVSKTVPADDCEHVLFVFPNGGLQVSPGQVYAIKVSGGRGVFGWKYVVGGYPNGVASFNDKPLVRDTRSTFLFRT